MTPEQESVYYNWKRVFWTAVVEGEVPAVIVLQDREDENSYCVWTQWSEGEPTLKFFTDLVAVRQELIDISATRFYPDLQLP